jgi:23S rRNA pseudouridine1911/1915/1917 synthase
MTVYYEDNDIIVCEKPYGVSSQESDGENMVNLLKSYTGCEIFCVHRLDIQTTGIMVYAKNKESAGVISTQIANGQLKKRYMCVCHGICNENGEMNDLLFHDRVKNKTFAVSTKRKGAKEAGLAYKRLATAKIREKDVSLVEVLLYTGRTHQIRAQFSSRGYVLYGDGKYGAKDNSKIALHSHKIEFFHPKTKEKLSFISNPNGEIWDLFTE